MNVNYYVKLTETELNEFSKWPLGVQIAVVALPIVLVLLIQIIFGVNTRRMNRDKGYKGGFAWGFFLGVVGLMVVAVRPFNLNDPKYSVTRLID